LAFFICDDWGKEYNDGIPDRAQNDREKLKERLLRRQNGCLLAKTRPKKERNDRIKSVRRIKKAGQMPCFRV